jgi:hypothetical protein
VTEENRRQGMRELLAKQQAGPPVTPAEATRRRRSARSAPVPDSVHSDSAGPGQQDRATRRQQGGIIEAAAREADVETGVGGSQVTARSRGRATSRPQPGPVRRVVSRAADQKGTLLAAACAVAVPAVWWLVAARRTQRMRLLGRARR